MENQIANLESYTLLKVLGEDLYNGSNNERFDDFYERETYLAYMNNDLTKTFVESFDSGLDDACFDIATIYYNRAIVGHVEDELLHPLFDAVMPDPTLQHEAAYVLGYEAAKRLLIPKVISDRVFITQFFLDSELPSSQDSADKRLFRHNIMLCMNVQIVDLMREAFLSGLHVGSMRYDLLECIFHC